MYDSCHQRLRKFACVTLTAAVVGWMADDLLAQSRMNTRTSGGKPTTHRVAPAAESNVSEEQAASWGAQLEVACRSGEVQEVLDLLDSKTLIDRCLQHAPQQAREDKELRKVILEDARGLRAAMLNFAQFAEAGTDYSFIKSFERDGHRVVLMRMLKISGDYNYHEWQLIADEDGEAKAIDTRSFLIDRDISSMLFYDFITEIVEACDGNTEQFRVEDREFFESLDQIAALNQAVLNQNYVEFFAIVDGFPDSVRNSIAMLRPRLVNARQLRDTLDASYEWASAMREMREHYPNSPSVHMLECNRLLGEGDLAGAIPHFQALRDRVGDDGYLNRTLAILYQATGQLELARPEAVKSMEIERNTEAYVLGLQIAQESGDEKWLTQILTSIPESSDCNLQVLEAREGLEAVRATPAYQDWKRSQSGQAPESSGSSIRDLLRRK